MTHEEQIQKMQEGIDTYAEKAHFLQNQNKLLSEAMIQRHERKAKEIALDAALKNKPNYALVNYTQITVPHPVYDLVKEAEKIFQWLIKPDKEDKE